ncbi:MAG TPA: YdeI/OmpD-associated family protein [Gemmatimonadaceae bacterium]
MPSKKVAPAEAPVLELRRQAEWAAWLEKHHRSSSGVWLRLGKKGSGVQSVSHAEALEVALCYGWIDGQRRSEGERTWIQRFTPRGTRSIWSKINRQKALELIESGRMRPAGLEEVERAREDGRWDAAYDAQRTATVPDDLRAALDANPRAKAFFATLDSRNRYAVLFRIHTAKKPETRARRIAQFVAMLERHETLHP